MANKYTMNTIKENRGNECTMQLRKTTSIILYYDY